MSDIKPFVSLGEALGSAVKTWTQEHIPTISENAVRRWALAFLGTETIQGGNNNHEFLVLELKNEFGDTYGDALLQRINLAEFLQAHEETPFVEACRVASVAKITEQGEWDEDDLNRLMSGVGRS